MMKTWMTLAVLTVSSLAYAAFDFADDGKSLTLTENGKPVLVYNYQPVSPPTGVPEKFTRACYIHPLYGLDGEILTEDFPKDHYHHRGVFWAWPECTAGDRRMDVWALDGVRQRQDNLKKEIKDNKAIIAAENRWSFDDAPDKAVIHEEVTMTVSASTDTARAIDFVMKFTNVCPTPVTFLGATNKGYGGLCFRPDATRKPFTFTSAKGVSEKDELKIDTPWADISFANGKGGTSGLAIFENPKNPGYPFPGWIFRHYGFLGASWPHEQTHRLAPGESFILSYRMFVHKNDAAGAKVADGFAAYAKEK